MLPAQCVATANHYWFVMWSQWGKKIVTVSCNICFAAWLPNAVTESCHVALCNPNLVAQLLLGIGCVHVHVHGLMFVVASVIC